MVLSVNVCMGQKMEDVENVDRIVDNMQLVKNKVSNKFEDLTLYISNTVHKFGNNICHIKNIYINLQIIECS